MGEGPRGSHVTCSTLRWFSVTPSSTHNETGLFWCWFPRAWPYAHSRPLWVSPMNSPVRLGVSPAAASTPTGVFIQRFEALFPRARALDYMVCFTPLLFFPVYLCANVVTQSLPATICGVCQLQLGLSLSTTHHLAGSSSHRLAVTPLCPGCPSPPLLLVWMNVSSLSPWLSDLHTVLFSVSSGCFLFLNCCCPSFGCVRRHSLSTYTSILSGSYSCVLF